MSLILCPECNKQISDRAESCPKCGYVLTPEKIAEIKKNEKQVSKGCGIGCLSVVAIFAILWMFGVFSSDQEENMTPWTPSASSNSAINSLISGTVSDWQQASHNERIGASRAIVKTLIKNDTAWRKFADNRLGYATKELEICISTTVNGAAGAIPDQKISEIAALCSVFMKEHM